MPPLGLRRIADIQRTYRHATRYSEILAVLFRFGFGDVVARLSLEKYLRVALPTVLRNEVERAEDMTYGEKLRRVLEELGPAFVKFGQILSTHPEIIPKEWCDQLAHLQEEVEPFSWEEAKEILDDELEDDWRENFTTLTEQPVAAASIGQVHAGVLKDGTPVVVKIQRPGIRRRIETDMDIMLYMAKLLEQQGITDYQLVDLVHHFGEFMAQELNYNVEAGQQDRFAENFEKWKDVKVPFVVHEFTTARILVMERVEGVKPKSRETLQQAGFDATLVAKRGFDHLLHSIFHHGFFHGDPHPGNLRIMPSNRICYMDFGLMGRLTESQRRHFAALIAGIARRDARTCTREFLLLAQYDHVPDRRSLFRHIDEMLTRHVSGALKDLDLGELLQNIAEVLGEHRMHLPQDFLLMIKALSTMEGIARSLDPDFDPLGQAEPFLRRYQFQSHKPGALARDIRESVADAVHFVQELPDQVREILQKARKGQLEVRLRHQNLESILENVDEASTRLSLALLVGALLISSAIVIHADIPPTYRDMPVLGVFGFVVAGLVSVWLIFTLLRKRWRSRKEDEES